MTPLVMVHGFMGGGDQWEPQLADFSRYAEVVAVDLPGFGKNAGLAPIASIAGMAAWVLEELQALGVTRFHLLGHSMGGMIVQEMAHHAAGRIDHLVLYSTGAVGLLPGRFETIAESKRRAEEEGVRKTARRISATWFREREQSLAFEACACIAEMSAAAAVQGALDAMADWDGVDRLGSIKVPTLIMWSDGDRTYPWSQTERLWKTIPRSGLSVVPGCAHAVHLEKPGLFNPVIADFLWHGEAWGKPGGQKPGACPAGSRFLC